MRQLGTIRLELSEFEALRLCDLEGLEQAAAGVRMGVSRGTVQRLVKRGRGKIITALSETMALVIEKGTTDEDLHSNG